MFVDFRSPVAPPYLPKKSQSPEAGHNKASRSDRFEPDMGKMRRMRVVNPQKRADPHVARESVYKPHVGPRSIVIFVSVFLSFPGIIRGLAGIKKSLFCGRLSLPFSKKEKKNKDKLSDIFRDSGAHFFGTLEVPPRRTLFGSGVPG